MNNYSLSKKLKSVFDKIKKKIIRNLKDNLALPVIVGCVFGFMTGFASWYGRGAGPDRFIFTVIMGLLGAILSSVVVFVGIEWNRCRVCRKTEEVMATKSIMEAVARIEAKEPYSSLMKLQTELPWTFMDFFTTVMKNSINSGGGVVVSAGSEEYLEYLGSLLEISREKIQLTLRGGKDKPKYTLGWFNRPDTVAETPPAGMTKKEKLEYLDKVNNAKAGDKMRILIFDKHRREEFEDFLNPEIRKNYFQHSQNVNCYLIKPDELLNLLEKKGITKHQAQFIVEDYAIFDGQVVLKHNGMNSLLVSIKNQINWYKTVFQVLEEHPDRFLKVTETTIGDKSWEDFEKELDWATERTNESREEE